MPAFIFLRFVLLLAAVLFSCVAVHAQSNSGKIVFADESGRLQVINADGTGQTFLTDGGNNIDDNPVYSPDGSKIAFDRRNTFGTNIFVMNADGTNPVALTTGDISGQKHSFDPSWSPDGTKLVFSSNRTGPGKTEIWVMNADGSGLVRLTTSVQVSADGQGAIFSHDIGPAWSPDGSQIAFVSSRNGLTDTELYVMNADGSNQTRLTDNTSDDQFPTWSPDSQRIGFSMNPIGLRIINRDGTNLVVVTNEGAWPAWSPDGLRFTYVALDPNNFFLGAIYIINIDGTNKVKVTNNNFAARAPAWAPSSSPPIPSFTISGQIKDVNGAPISGVTLKLFTTLFRTTQSDAAGFYSFAGLAAGNYRIDVSKSGYGFTTPFVILDNVTSNQTVNFTGFVAFSISGQLTPPVGGLVVTLTGTVNRTVFSDLGRYSFDLLPAGGNYTVSINTPFWTVTPNNVTFNNLSANQIANFDLVLNKFTISGTITRLGNPKPGITVQLSNNSGFAPATTTTDANGQYSFTGVNAGGPYTVRPVGANYVFDPQTRDVVLDGNKTADFIALSANHLLFNRPTYTVIEGTLNVVVTVVRGGNCCGVGPITVDYATADGTAKAGLDFTGVSGTLNFPEGTTSQNITIPITDDQVREGAEQFSILLSNPTGEVDLASPSTASVTILDNEVRLITEGDSDRAIALTNPTSVTGPFSVTTEMNFSADTRTRISLFVEDLQFNQGLQFILIDAVDVNQNHFQLQLEVIAVSSFFPFRQLIVRLPQNLPAGDLLITINVNGVPSNTARISIKP